MSDTQPTANDGGLSAYLVAAQSIRDRATDEYDRLWWAIEVETRCTLTSSAIHKRVMRALQCKR